MERWAGLAPASPPHFGSDRSDFRAPAALLRALRDRLVVSIDQPRPVNAQGGADHLLSASPIGKAPKTPVSRRSSCAALVPAASEWHGEPGSSRELPERAHSR